jgi:hypothetical protein
VRLLDALPEELHATLSCIGFAVPPLGNAQLAEAAAAAGWQRRITNYVLPEDFVPGLLGMLGRQGSGGAVDSGGLAGGDPRDGGPSAGPGHERVCCGHGGAFWPDGCAAAAAPAAAP